jgi:hypothetical protein
MAAPFNEALNTTVAFNRQPRRIGRSGLFLSAGLGIAHRAL